MQRDTGGSDTYITEVVELIFARAVAAGASDIHLDPTPAALRVRFRVDGAVADQGNIPLEHHETILTRLKVLADLDITAQPTPQDGHFELNLELLQARIEKLRDGAPSLNTDNKSAPNEQRMLDVRISVFPTVNGEAAVCRLLNRADVLFSISQLGLDTTDLDRMRRLSKRSFGMILITGPVGSGKTTALYSLLQETSGDDKTVVTLEDPVEFRFPNIRQIQMNPERGMTFAIGMRSILRQDPDIIMIGEIRDSETAEHAIRASLVGRIVFSTVHSNTAVGTIARLIDMGVERSLIAYALNGVISTRLVRKNCPYCIEDYQPSAEYLKDFGIEAGAGPFKRGRGCEKCGGKGYLGRTGIFEILEFDDTLRALIIDRASMADLSTYVVSRGMTTLRESGKKKALEGLTTLESVAHMI